MMHYVKGWVFSKLIRAKVSYAYSSGIESLISAYVIPSHTPALISSSARHWTCKFPVKISSRSRELFSLVLYVVKEPICFEREERSSGSRCFRHVSEILLLGTRWCAWRWYLSSAECLSRSAIHKITHVHHTNNKKLKGINTRICLSLQTHIYCWQQWTSKCRENYRSCRLVLQPFVHKIS